MRKLLLASSALVFAGSAFAADMRMPTKAPPPVAAPFSWTGCYIGAHAGYGWGQKEFSDPQLGGFFTIAPPGAVVDVDTDGWLAGGQVGCNYQTGSFVFGLEGEFSWANIDGFANDPFFIGKNGAPQTLAAQTEWIGSVTGRVGYAFDRFLVYGKGGAAWAHDQYDAALFFLGFFTPATNFTGSEDRFGWTVGGGIEYAFWDRWSLKLEYNHFEFGDRRVNLLDPVFGSIVPADIEQRVDTIKIGVNYRFWSAF
jgi:outer membrane immunogenic protein